MWIIYKIFCAFQYVFLYCTDLKNKGRKLPDWAKRFVLVTWLRVEPSADFSIFLITTSPGPVRPFCALSSFCCRSSCKRVSRSFSLWSGEGDSEEQMMSVEKKIEEEGEGGQKS